MTDGRPVALLVGAGHAEVGPALARALVDSGRLVLVQHDGDPAPTIAALADRGVEAEPLAGTPGSTDAARALIAAAAGRGRLDLVVLVADTEPATGPAEDAAWQRWLDRAVQDTRRCAVAAAGTMNGGAVVVVVPRPARAADPAAVVGTAAEGLARHLAVHLAGQVRVSTVAGDLADSRTHLEVARLVTVLAADGTGALSGQTLVATATATAPATAGPTSAARRRRTADRTAPDHAVAVVGMGLAVPGANSPDQLWTLLGGDRPVFAEPGDRMDLATMWSADTAAEDRTYARTAGFLTGFEPHPRLRKEIEEGSFDAEEYTARWLRHSLLQATEDVVIRSGDRQLFAVGLTPDGSHHLEQSLVVSSVRRLLTELGRPVPEALADLYPLATDAPTELLPYRIARLAAADLPGDAEIVALDTACSSSLYALDVGLRALRAGEVDVALCGGAFALNVQSVVLFSKLRGLSRSGDVRALDRDADGVLFSDGAVVLALKTYGRATADGDPVLGFVAGFGGSSDGRGKAIYTPNPVGQRIALRRAWDAAGTEPAEVDWVIAHATGTPTGDRTELSTLAEHAGAGKTWTVTSNKSLIGHSGWAAGAVSAVHGLLSLRHELIPAQQRFAALPEGIGAGVDVPVRDVPWPARPDRRRVVGVSAMGFGGTNGHLLLTDDVPADSPAPAAPVADDPVVVVGWSSHLPGDPDRDQVRRWLAGGPPEWPASFGADYPLPSPVEARLAPSALAAMDRTQLMALRCADAIAGEWTRDAALRERTGVFVGHSGPTGSASRWDLRAYLADLTAKLPSGADLAERVRALSEPATEDSYPGLMPNIIAARVAQRLDLHGPNMTLEAGRDSTSSAVVTAVRQLRDDQVELAVVLGVNATLEFPGPDGRPPAEVALALLLARRSTARAHGLPVFGEVGVLAAGDDVGDASVATLDSRDNRGAEGAVTLLRALHGQSPKVVVPPVEDAHTPRLRVSLPVPERAEGPGGRLERHALVLHPVPARSTGPVVEALPAGCLVLTDDPAGVLAADLPADCTLIVPAEPTDQGPDDPRVHRVADAADLPAALGDRRPDQVRLIVSGSRDEPGADPLPLLRRRLLLDDLLLVAAQHCADALDAGGCLAVLLLDGWDRDVLRPHVGVVAGVVRSLQLELPGCLTYALVTDVDEARLGLEELAAESGCARYLPVAYRRAGRRRELMLLPEPPAPAGSGLRLPAEPVILATGGARGITARLVEEIVAGSRPQAVWLLGTGPEPAAADAELPADRTEALRLLAAQRPGESVARLNKRYERSLHARERAATLAELDRLLPGRVRYRSCDVLDAAAVRAVVDEVVAAEGRVDVLVHGAGLVRTATLARKKLVDFRAVRDVKVLGHAHLRAALAGREPALWCDLSSVSAFMGRRGEPDYGAGNEYLLLAAAHAATVEGRDEAAMASGLWVESGMASADTVGGSFLARQGEIGQLTDADGRAFYRAELAGRGSRGLGTTWVGPADWATLERAAPGFRAACLAAAAAGRRPGGAAGEPRGVFLPAGADPADWTVDLDLDRHRYLLHHLVDGRPTMPGTVILELAAEAAVGLAPGLVPVGFDDVVFSRFVRAPAAQWPRTVRVTSRRDGDRVVVRVSRPAVGEVPEWEYSRMTVRLAASMPEPPRSSPATEPGRPAPDTYRLPDGPLELRGAFSALRRPRFLPDGGRADLVPTFPADTGPYEGFLLPSFALDCTLRTVVLDGADADRVPVMVPGALTRVDFHVRGNDLALADRWADGITLRHWSAGTAGGDDRCAAVAPDGQVLLSVTGITGVAKAVYDVRSGRWRSGRAEA